MAPSPSLPNGRTETAIELTTTVPHFGGLRYWYVCPNCDRRKRKLYAFMLREGWGFACRLCLGVAYESQYCKDWLWVLTREIRGGGSYRLRWSKKLAAALEVIDARYPFFAERIRLQAGTPPAAHGTWAL